MNFAINDTVFWKSAAGNLSGTIKNIVLSKNAADQIVPWMDVAYIAKNGREVSTRLCATDSNIKMMSITKTAPVAMMTVQNLMTGQDVEIPVDTPWCCNPASETYWSM